MRNKTKTIAEVLQEYINRLNKPEYEEIGIQTLDGHVYSYNRVTNLSNRDGWIVFDSVYKNFKRHVKIQGEIVRYINNIEE